MADALALAEKIADTGLGGGGDNLDEAIQSYEERMFSRGVDLITKSSRNGQLMFYQNGPERLVQALKSGTFGPCL